MLNSYTDNNHWKINYKTCMFKLNTKINILPVEFEQL